MDYQNISSFLECYFVGNWFIALQCRMIHYFVKFPGELNSWVMVTQDDN